MIFSVQILGSNSALAAHGRYPSAQIVQHDNSYFLVDCGEGTQMRMSEFHVKRFKIQQVFISHLHGDHYFGLIGLLTSYHLMGRLSLLTIYGPEALKEIIQIQLNASNTQMSYEIEFIPTDPNCKKLIMENDNIRVYSFPLKHRISTTGFLFEERSGKRRINKNKVMELHLGSSDFSKLKRGKDIQIGEKVYKNEELTLEPYPTRSYAYCSDTCFFPDLVQHISGVDLLYHEATFMNDASQKANDTYHSTTIQAGEIANLIGAKNLLIGHFSSKYDDLNEPLRETTQVFENTKIAEEGVTFFIDKKQEVFSEV